MAVTASAPTTRVTTVGYIDQNGDQATLEIPGWVGAVSHFMAAEIEFTHVLGQLYIERPYASMKDAPSTLTVADLRSVVGDERMLQEFDGVVQDPAQISEGVSQRLGPEMPKWRIVSTIVLKRATRH